MRCRNETNAVLMRDTQPALLDIPQPWWISNSWWISTGSAPSALERAANSGDRFVRRPVDLERRRRDTSDDELRGHPNHGVGVESDGYLPQRTAGAGRHFFEMAGDVAAIVAAGG